MIKNYIRTAWRNLLKNKGFSLINISGLAIGMASAILILLWVQNQLSHDRFHKNVNRTYVMNNRDRDPEGKLWAWPTTPKILGPTLKHDYPEVEEMARVNNSTFYLTRGETQLKCDGIFTDPGFLSVFSFPLVKGNIHEALNGGNKIVLTEKLAKKLFGNNDPLGKTVKIDSTDYMTVSGVLKDLPNNTIFNFEYLLPWSYMKKLGWDDDYWGNNSIMTFVMLKKGASQAAFDRKIRKITIEHSQNSGETTTEVFTHPFADHWLYSKPVNGQYDGGRIERVRLFIVIAVFILLIACINFMNLSTARSQKRAREVGIRKVVGAPREKLIIQFISESILIALIAGIIALILVQLCLPWYNILVNIPLHVEYGSFYFWASFIFFILFTGILAGSYPAFFLSSFKPVKVLKGTFQSAGSIITPRKILVVTQFTFAIILIISTIIVKHQINYALSRDTGYSKEQLVYSYLQGDISKNYELIRNELLSSGAAVSVTKTMSPITQRYSDSWGFQWPGSTEKDKKIDFVRMSTDAGFTKTMGIKLLAGRDIDIYSYPTDSNAVMLNETAAKTMRLKDPVGQIVKEGETNWHVVGVFRDFVFESPYSKVNPLLTFGPDSWFSVIHYRLNPSHSVKENLKLAEGIFKKYNPGYPYQYNFADESYADKFRDEQQTATLTTLFSGLTIFISCLGLFGLANYMAESRTKEIGIRKVLGAGVFNITTLLSADFLKLVIISFVIASPVAWYSMHRWLENYEYRVAIEWWIFGVSCLLTILIAVATVSFQSVKAALANPVKSLRSE